MPHTLDENDLQKIAALSDEIITVIKTSAKSGDAVEDLFLTLNEKICKQIS
jgi:hypothetical protein